MMDKSTREGMCSHKTTEWFTPPYIFARYNSIYHFATDVCTSPSNPLGCPVFFTKDNDGLANFDNWKGNIWCNPPYGNKVDKWVPPCAKYAALGRGVAVMLIAARTDTKRFHKYIWNTEKQKPRENVEMHFLEGRIKFLDAAGNRANAPFFPSMVVIFRPTTITV